MVPARVRYEFGMFSVNINLNCVFVWLTWRVIWLEKIPPKTRSCTYILVRDAGADKFHNFHRWSLLRLPSVVFHSFQSNPGLRVKFSLKTFLKPFDRVGHRGNLSKFERYRADRSIRSWNVYNCTHEEEQIDRSGSAFAAVIKPPRRAYRTENDLESRFVPQHDSPN